MTYFLAEYYLTPDSLRPSFSKLIEDVNYEGACISAGIINDTICYYFVVSCMCDPFLVYPDEPHYIN